MAQSVQPGAAFGPMLLPGPGLRHAEYPYSTAVSNPGLAMTVNNFAAGNIIVKNPVTGGMTNPSTYLDSVWAGAGVPNTTERFFRDDLSSFVVDEHTTAVYLMEDLGGKQDPFHLNFGVRVVSTSLTIDNGQSAPSPTYFGTASWNGVDSNVIPSTPSAATSTCCRRSTSTRTSRIRRRSASARRAWSRRRICTRSASAIPTISPAAAAVDDFHLHQWQLGQREPRSVSRDAVVAVVRELFRQGRAVQRRRFLQAGRQLRRNAERPDPGVGRLDGNVNEPVNAGKGKIYGFELGGQYCVRQRPGCAGFGVAANYTYSQSNSDQLTSVLDHRRSPAWPRLLHGQAYYERYGFSAGCRIPGGASS